MGLLNSRDVDKSVLIGHQIGRYTIKGFDGDTPILEVSPYYKRYFDETIAKELQRLGFNEAYIADLHIKTPSAGNAVYLNSKKPPESAMPHVEDYKNFKIITDRIQWYSMKDVINLNILCNRFYASTYIDERNNNKINCNVYVHPMFAHGRYFLNLIHHDEIENVVTSKYHLWSVQHEMVTVKGYYYQTKTVHVNGKSIDLNNYNEVLYMLKHYGYSKENIIFCSNSSDSFIYLYNNNELEYEKSDIIYQDLNVKYIKIETEKIEDYILWIHNFKSWGS